MYSKRIKKLLEKISDKEGILVSNPTNCYYLSGIRSSNINLYITKNEKYLITDFRYAEIAEKNQAGFKVLSDIGLFSYLKEIITENKVYIEADYISHEFFLKLKENLKVDFLLLGNIVNDMRAIKDDYEIDCIKKSQEISDKAFEETLPLFYEGVTEKEIKAELEYHMAKYGSEKPSFDTIVLFGNHTSLPHGEAGERKLKNRDIILIDFGSTYSGYCSDNTRTFFFGKPDEEIIKAYNHVLEAHKLARDFIKVGTYGKNADKKARDFLNKNGYENLFGHSLGHGVGLEIHENVRLSPKSEDILLENMIFSIEPGIYFENKFGIRIEDIYLLKKDSVKSLTTLNKELLIL